MICFRAAACAPSPSRSAFTTKASFFDVRANMPLLEAVLAELKAFFYLHTQHLQLLSLLSCNALLCTSLAALSSSLHTCPCRRTSTSTIYTRNSFAAATALLQRCRSCCAANVPLPWKTYQFPPPAPKEKDAAGIFMRCCAFLWDVEAPDGHVEHEMLLIPASKCEQDAAALVRFWPTVD